MIGNARFALIRDADHGNSSRKRAMLEPRFTSLDSRSRILSVGVRAWNERSGIVALGMNRKAFIFAGASGDSSMTFKGAMYSILEALV